MQIQGCKIREAWDVGKEVRTFQGNWKHDTETYTLLGVGNKPRPSWYIFILYTPWFLKLCIFFIKKSDCNCEQKFKKREQWKRIGKINLTKRDWFFTIVSLIGKGIFFSNKDQIFEVQVLMSNDIWESTDRHVENVKKIRRWQVLKVQCSKSFNLPVPFLPLLVK